MRQPSTSPPLIGARRRGCRAVLWTTTRDPIHNGIEVAIGTSILASPHIKDTFSRCSVELVPWSGETLRRGGHEGNEHRHPPDEHRRTIKVTADVALPRWTSGCAAMSILTKSTRPRSVGSHGSKPWKRRRDPTTPPCRDRMIERTSQSQLERAILAWIQRPKTPLCAPEPSINAGVLSNRPDTRTAAAAPFRKQPTWHDRRSITLPSAVASQGTGDRERSSVRDRTCRGGAPRP